MEKEISAVSQSTIAQALANDYFCIYYVNTEDDKFIEYSASEEYRELGLPRTGDDFISFSREYFEEVIFPEDRERFLETFTKENIVKRLDMGIAFTMTFRLVFHDVPTYVHLKITRMIEETGHHVVVGISSVDEQIKAREAYERAHQDSITYSRMAQVLAQDYFSIYVVDPDTDQFYEYSSMEKYGELGIEKEGVDFFNLSRKNMARVIYPGDRDRFLEVFTKEKIMNLLERDKSFTMKYRLMFGEEPVYVSMKAMLLEDTAGRHVIFGTNNIDAQMKQEQEYQAKMADARTSAKNDFLANMSHDIRTPMNAIVGYTNIASSHQDDPATVRDALEKIRSSSHFLLSLINDILDISKIESGKMQLSYGPCNLDELFGRIEDITALQAKNKSLRITYDHSSIRHSRVHADELRIEQILINIISNAIKYTPAGQEVHLVAEELGPAESKERPANGEPGEAPEGEEKTLTTWEPGENPAGENAKYHYRIIIRDTGVGISEEYLPHIFESFTREQNTTINRVQGTGLGLAITAKVVEMMGGTISVRSKMGEGSEFTVELDLEALEEETAEETADEPEAVDLSGHRVLLVEDNSINAEIARMVLEQYGLTVDHAENGRAGVDRVQEAGDGVYSVVLMDIQMPVMNGYEATREIREQKEAYFQSLPIIAMSANAYDEDVKKCLAAGMNAHIAKPFQPEELVKLLKKYL